jgi:hypothetical protein
MFFLYLTFLFISDIFSLFFWNNFSLYLTFFRCQIRSALEEHFGSCGEIVRISIPKDYETGASKGSVGSSHINALYFG